MPGVHRHGDDRACGATTVVGLQSNVYANSKLIAVLGDPNSHGNGGLEASINPGTVYINNIELVVNGSTAEPDDLCPVSPHCDPDATTGSADVFAFD